MSKHTKGPWSLQLAEECTGRKLDGLVRWVVTANEHDLWISTGPTWDEEHSEESLANALLIAAAPELLAALEQIHAHGYTSMDDHEMVAAAIAKAKGETPSA